MPTWSEILDEINGIARATGRINVDAVRRKYLLELQAHTKRSTILYATCFTQKPAPSELLSIVDEDIHGLMEVIHSLPGPDLDLILHSPGGSVEAAEAFVKYIRSKFAHVRVMVPLLAQSAATMMACSANEIVLGKHSSLGPTDPQIQIRTPSGLTFVPAQAVTEQFRRAQADCTDPKKLSSWLPMLNQYGPHMLVTCDHASALSQELVAEWLSKYMFLGEPAKAGDAKRIAQWLSDHKNFKTHSRHICRDDVEASGMKVTHLENDQKLQDLVLSVFHATCHSFQLTNAAKIIENHSGRAFIKSGQSVASPPASPPKGPTMLTKLPDKRSRT